jgi:hypothetical protein
MLYSHLQIHVRVIIMKQLPHLKLGIVNIDTEFPGRSLGSAIPNLVRSAGHLHNYAGYVTYTARDGNF